MLDMDPHNCLVISMGDILLCTICSGLVLLVTALGLASPSIKSSARPPADEPLLIHMLDQVRSHPQLKHPEVANRER